MRRTDTIDKGPNKLLIKEWDAQNYFKHRRRVSEVKSRVDFGTGKHIVRISPHGPNKQRSDRANEIMNANKILFERIRGVLERPAYKKQTMFDSKAIAAKASLSPVALNRTMKTDASSMIDQSQAMLDGTSQRQMGHDSHLLLPTTKNFILPKRLTVSPRRMKIFHGHSIGNDNSVHVDLQSNKRQIQVGQNMVRIMHNQRQDKSEQVMKENHRMLQRLLATSPVCCDPDELNKRPDVLNKRNSIATQEPIKNTTFDRQKRLKSFTSLKKGDFNSHQNSGGSITRRKKMSPMRADLSLSQSSSQEERQNPTAMSDLQFAIMPNTTRNKDNTMGLTQPVFPKVGDKLGQTAAEGFEAITHRDDENVTSYEGTSMRQPFQQTQTLADLQMLNKKAGKKHKRKLEPIQSVPAGVKMRKQSLPKPLGVSSPGMSTNKFAIKKRSINALSSRVDSHSGFNAMTSTHLTASDASVSHKMPSGHPKNDSIFRATDSSYLNVMGRNAAMAETESRAWNPKPGIKVYPLSNEDGFQLTEQRPNRLTIYRARLIQEESFSPTILELQRDMKITNKLFIVLQAEDGMDVKRELFITLKQATNLLIKVKHDFKAFVEDLLCLKHGHIAIKNMSFQVFDTTQGNYSPNQLLNQSSSTQLQTFPNDASYKSFKSRDLVQSSAPRDATAMIPEEEDPPSKSVTDTSLQPESKVDVTESDLIKEFANADQDHKRRTQQMKGYHHKDMVSFKEDVPESQLTEQLADRSIETKGRPRADQVMQDLELDLSENDSNTNTGPFTENHSKMESDAIIEEESSQGTNQSRSKNVPTVIPPPEGHEPPASYNDFLGRQQTKIHDEEEAVQVNKLTKITAAQSKSVELEAIKENSANENTSGPEKSDEN